MKAKSLELLFSEEAWELPDTLYSCWNARGLYNPLQFVLRLRPDVHRELASAPSGVVASGELTGEQVYAFSTFLHENIHWWQHVGSVTGLYLSLIYPAQAHYNHAHLLRILNSIGPVKPLKAYGLLKEMEPSEDIDTDREVNIVVNNWHDIEFYRWLVFKPTDVTRIIRDPYFECIGHSYEIAIGSVISLLTSTFDQNFELFPDPRKWEPEMARLRTAKAKGFYYGSPAVVPPLGAREIFEGQARFSQLQYLYFSSGKSVSWAEFEGMGMLSGVYVDAFRTYLEATGLDAPDNLDSPVVGLFLLVCDIALNPVEGFAHDFQDLEDLVITHDPGMRFLRLCWAIRDHSDRYSRAICDYSAAEYWGVSSSLCTAAAFMSPRDLMDSVEAWISSAPSIANLLAEDDEFRFKAENLPIRVFFSRFLKLQLDKKAHPEFFCWNGVWMSSSGRVGISHEKSLALFEEHRALFVDKEDGDVYPRTFENRDLKAVHATFNDFYSYVSTYEMSRQWIVGSDGFKYNFSWLTTKYSQNEIAEWASRLFKSVFGVGLDKFRIIAEPEKPN